MKLKMRERHRKRIEGKRVEKTSFTVGVSLSEEFPIWDSIVKRQCNYFPKIYSTEPKNIQEFLDGN
nr:putative DNA replication origin-binding helicase [Pithovirus mammoth]